MKTILTSILLLLTALSSYAQNVVPPSNITFQKKWIKEESYKMYWYGFRDTTKIKIGEVTTIVNVNDDLLRVITSVAMKNNNSKWIDTTEARRSTLQPIRHSSYNAQRNIELNFGDVVTGFYRDNISKNQTQIHENTSGPYFDSNIYPSLLRWLPLKDGYQKELVIYDYSIAKKGLISAKIRNVRSGIFKTQKSGQFSVWILDVTDGILQGTEAQYTYYIEKSNRKLWKQEINISGRRMSMELVEE